MQHDFYGIPVEDDEDPAWQTIRAQALAAAVATLPPIPDGEVSPERLRQAAKEATDLGWLFACWIRHGKID